MVVCRDLIVINVASGLTAQLQKCWTWFVGLKVVWEESARVVLRYNVEILRKKTFFVRFPQNIEYESLWGFQYDLSSKFRNIEFRRERICAVFSLFGFKMKRTDLSVILWRQKKITNALLSKFRHAHWIVRITKKSTAWFTAFWTDLHFFAGASIHFFDIVFFYYLLEIRL